MSILKQIREEEGYVCSHVYKQNGVDQFYDNYIGAEYYIGRCDEVGIFPPAKKKPIVQNNPKVKKKVVKLNEDDGFPLFDTVDIYPNDFPDFPKAQPSIRDYVVI